MAQKHDKEAIIEPKLCIKCTEMYGHPNFDDMCSLCFKKQKTEQKLQEQKKLEPEPQTPKVLVALQTKQTTPEPECKKRQAPATSPPKTVPGKCSKCSKKTNMLGYNCKHCSNQFCKFHRLPQDHDCQVDFISLGRKQIKTDNPLVSHRKIQQI